MRCFFLGCFIATLFLPRACQARDLGTDTLLVFGQGYALGPMGEWTYPLGEHLLLYGAVARISLNTDFPDSFEYTYTFDNLISSSTLLWDDFTCQCGGQGNIFTGGILSLYQDETPDANCKQPNTYRDGALLLQATTDEYHSLWGECWWPDCPVYSHAYLVFNGGSIIGLVPINFGLKGASLILDYDQEVDSELRGLGIFATTTGTAVTNSHVAVEPTTWGRVKRLYK